ncbi:MAG: triose-phosphate isomerase [Proteobacteria bacterium]|nr:triose-phosphate isomerase [Pseudomonadota bacterium]
MKYFVANWKMHKTCAEALDFLEYFKNISLSKEEYVIIAPPFTLLWPLSKSLQDSKIKLSAQNMYCEDKGAFTGEISPIQLKDCNVDYVIIGHSERRNIFHEDNELISKKLKKAFEYNITPIFCVGETLEQRQKGLTFDTISNQLSAGLAKLSEDEISKIIIAYEPVWAIGTGVNATPEQAEEVHLFINSFIQKNYFKNKNSDVKILYGGSVTPSNIKDLMNISKIDGVLVGGASLQQESFLKIVKYKGEDK